MVTGKADGSTVGRTDGRKGMAKGAGHSAWRGRGKDRAIWIPGEGRKKNRTQMAE